MQSDGNLVEYLASSRSPRWETGTSGNFGAYAVVQADGDFVVYPKGKSAPPPGDPTLALWSSGSFGHPGSLVKLQDDGVVVVHAAADRQRRALGVPMKHPLLKHLRARGSWIGSHWLCRFEPRRCASGLLANADLPVAHHRSATATPRETEHSRS